MLKRILCHGFLFIILEVPNNLRNVLDDILRRILNK